MLEQVGDLWQKHSDGYWVVIPTNLQVDKYGHAIMGAGLAKEAAHKFPELPKWLGQQLNDRLAVEFYYAENIICFPTKSRWQSPSTLKLIEKSVKELEIITYWNDLFNQQAFGYPVYIPRVGCGLGLLSWRDVKPVLEQHLDDRFVALSQE